MAVLITCKINDDMIKTGGALSPQNFLHYKYILVTSKFDDLIENERASLETLFSPL